MADIFEEILAGEAQIKESLNFYGPVPQKKNYAEFEKEYQKILNSLDDFNPSLPENEALNFEFRKQMSGLIKKWGYTPVIVYNEYMFKGRTELSTFEQRVSYYEKADDLLKNFQRFYSDQNIYGPDYHFKLLRMVRRGILIFRIGRNLIKLHWLAQLSSSKKLFLRCSFLWLQITFMKRTPHF